MAIPWQFHEGNRAEFLAMYFLSKVGFVVPVPRQSDQFGVDFIVHLMHKNDKKYIPTGKAFAVQVKSNNSPIHYKTEKRGCLWDMALPFFIGVVSQDGMSFSMYQTLSRLNFMWKIGQTIDFSIQPNGAMEALHASSWDNNCIQTGPAAIKISASSTENQDPNINFYEIIESWIKYEELSISWKTQQIPLVICPGHYVTNQCPTGTRVTAYANPNSLEQICVAVKAPLSSLNYYLNDFIQRHDSSEINATNDLVAAIHELQSDSQATQDGASKIARLLQDT